MDSLPLSTIAAFCGGRLSAQDDRLVDSVSKDTRTLAPGDLYIAIDGENFDGHRFVADAAARGASAALVSRDPDPAPPSDFPIIRVSDTLAALQAMAAAWRAELSLRAVAITGSSGKTSTKEYSAAAIGVRFPVIKTEGNFNNHIGVPLSILAANSTHRAAVWEMGMNHPGEIAPLARLARPDIAIVTNIGVAHIEFFPDQDGIAAEKADIFRGLDSDGVAVIPATDRYADFLAGRAPGRVVRAGIDTGDVRGENVSIDESGSRFRVHSRVGSCNVHLPVPGRHMVSNALLAIAAAIELGLSPEECADGLASARAVSGRLTQLSVRGVRLIDDTYNANPDSIEAALAAAREISSGSKLIAVLGCMGELGSYAETGYRRVAGAAARLADCVITVGAETGFLAEETLAAGCKEVIECEDAESAATLLRGIANAGDLVLIKGSRAARMERVIAEFSKD